MTGMPQGFKFKVQRYLVLFTQSNDKWHDGPTCSLSGAVFGCRIVATLTWRRSSFLPVRASKTPSPGRCRTGTMWSPLRSNRGRGSSLLPMETVWGGSWSILRVGGTVGAPEYSDVWAVLRVTSAPTVYTPVVHVLALMGKKQEQFASL